MKQAKNGRTAAHRDPADEPALDLQAVDRLDDAWDRFLGGADDRQPDGEVELEALRRLHARATPGPAAARRIRLAAFSGPAAFDRHRAQHAPGLLPFGGVGWPVQALAAALLIATLVGIAGSFLGGPTLPGGDLFGPETTSAAPAPTATAPLPTAAPDAGPASPDPTAPRARTPAAPPTRAPTYLPNGESISPPRTGGNG